MILPTLPPKMLPALSHLANSLHTIGDYYVAGDVDAALNVAREEPLMLPLGAVIGGLALASRGGSLPKPPPTLLAGTNLDGKPLRLAYRLRAMVGERNAFTTASTFAGVPSSWQRVAARSREATTRLGGHPPMITPPQPAHSSLRLSAAAFGIEWAPQAAPPSTTTHDLGPPLGLMH